ncbi:unnamed protein product [Eruca vesicaria subsp. sativa]|uniref:Zinc finger GRF-type domain-containing protein n=1 Tax=Eruca vesicaria subsp. sativa TaxID=29727 RepID=A0ABC8L8W2_ERUVS|nr:unnamed protein product [Eruca vesicaria subsp. sativa]
MSKSTSASSSSSSGIKTLVSGPLCWCSRHTNVTMSWSEENPGRRFNRCEIHGFVSWVDKEEPSNWQKVSLLEARNQIRRYKRETSDFRSTIAESNAVIESLRSSTERNDDVEIRPCENQICELWDGAKKTMRTMFIITWVLMLITTSMIIISISK